MMTGASSGARPIVEALAGQRQPADRTTRAVSYRLGAIRNEATPMSSATPSGPLTVDYLNGPDVAALALTDDEILTAVEAGLAAQGRGETVIEPRVHLAPGRVVQRSFQRASRLHRAAGARRRQGRRRFRRQLAARPARRRWASSTCSIRARDGPVAIIDAAGLTDMRTGAVTAIGAKYLARKNSRVLGHVGARGTAYWNVRLLDRLFDFDEIRVHSRRPESRDAFAQRLSRDLGKAVVATADWESCVRGADIVVEASRLAAPEPMLKTSWIAPRRVRRALRHDERRRALAHRHHGQDRRRRLGPMSERPVRQSPRARRCRQAVRVDAPCGAGRNRQRPQSRPRKRRRDHPAVASRAVDIRHRAGRGDARRRRNGWASAKSSGMHDAAIGRPRAAMIANARMYAHGRHDGRRVAGVARVGGPPRRASRSMSSITRRRSRCRRCGRARISGARSCAAIRSRTRRCGPRFSPRRCRARAQYGGQPVYWTDLVVAADAPIADLPDAFGKRIAWTAEDSQSGWHAPRLLLAAYARRHGAPLFAETVGPLVTPRNVALAVADGRADIGPLDSYAHDLLRRHEPALAARLRVIARTPATPIPPLVGAPWHGRHGRAARCGRRSLAVGSRARARDARANRCCCPDSPPSRADAYDALVADARRADALGYPRIA